MLGQGRRGAAIYQSISYTLAKTRYRTPVSICFCLAVAARIGSAEARARTISNWHTLALLSACRKSLPHSRTRPCLRAVHYLPPSPIAFPDFVCLCVAMESSHFVRVKSVHKSSSSAPVALLIQQTSCFSLLIAAKNYDVRLFAGSRNMAHACIYDSLRLKLRTFKKLAIVISLRKEDRAGKEQALNLSSLPQSVLDTIASYLAHEIDVLPLIDPDAVKEEQEVLIDELFHSFYIPNDPYDCWDSEDEGSMNSTDFCDGYCCFPSTPAPTSSQHHFRRAWEPQPLECDRCCPEDAWMQMVLNWHSNHHGCQTVSLGRDELFVSQSRSQSISRLIRDHGLSVSKFPSEPRPDYQMYNPLIWSADPLYLSMPLPKHMPVYAHKAALKKRFATAHLHYRFAQLFL